MPDGETLLKRAICAGMLLSFSAAAENLTSTDIAALDECLSFVTQTKSASEAKDWPNAERLAKREIEVCNASPLPTYMRGNSYSRLAKAQLSLGRYADALKAIDECIALYYRSPACHYQRYTTLFMLDRAEDAVKEVQVAHSVSNQILKEKANPNGIPLYQSWLAQAKEMARFVLKDIPDNIGAKKKIEKDRQRT